MISTKHFTKTLKFNNIIRNISNINDKLINTTIKKNVLTIKNYEQKNFFWNTVKFIIGVGIIFNTLSYLSENHKKKYKYQYQNEQEQKYVFTPKRGHLKCRFISHIN